MEVKGGNPRVTGVAFTAIRSSSARWLRREGMKAENRKSTFLLFPQPKPAVQAGESSALSWEEQYFKLGKAEL